MSLPLAITLIIVAAIIGGIAGFALGGGAAVVDIIGRGGPRGN